MRSKNYGINVRVTEQEKQKLLENARFCSLPLSEYLRRLGLGKEVRAAITERDYRLFRMLNGLKAELPQLQKEEILSRLEAILNELKGFIEKLVVFYLENSGHKITLYTKRWFALANHFFLCYNIFRYFSIFGGFLLTLNQYLL